MSGIELAGLILAIFPVVVEGVELYVKGVNALERWWRFSRVLKRLLRRIRLERLKFQQNCEALLCGITEPGQLDRLLKDPGGPEWTLPDLQGRLEKQLGDSYHAYMEAAIEIKEMLERLRSKLELDQSGKVRGNNTLSPPKRGDFCPWVSRQAGLCRYSWSERRLCATCT